MSSPSAAPRLGRPPDVMERVAAQIAAEIAVGTYPAGSKLPSIRKLEARFRTSKETVSKALDALHDSGHITRRPGKGAIVNRRQHTVTNRAATDIVRGEEEWRGLTAAVRRSGGQPYSVITGVAEIPASEEIATRLDVPLDTPVVKRARIQGAVEEGHRVPIQLSWSYYRLGVADRVPGIRQEAERGPTQIRSEIVKAYGAVRYEHNTDARFATAGECDLLGLPDTSIVFDVWRTCTEVESGILLEVTRIVMDARKVTLNY